MPDPNETQPLIGLEQWIDFVIASAAHRSQNAGHQKFGDMLIQRYFVTLPERYKDNPIATRYFDEILCAVASAIRGFSVVRDIFQTNWETMKTAKDAALKTAERVEAFSPIKKDGIWGIIVAAMIGLGAGVPIMEAVKKKWATESLPSLLVLVGTVATTIVLLALLMELLRSWLIGRAEAQFPTNLLESWEERSLKGYRTVLKQFVPLAVEITNRHYPGSSPDVMTDVEVDALIERHFAFKSKAKSVAQSDQNLAVGFPTAASSTLYADQTAEMSQVTANAQGTEPEAVHLRGSVSDE